MSLFFALAFLAAGPSGVIVRPVANLHAEPVADSAVVSQAIFGTTVDFLEKRSGWVKVRTADGYSGWMDLAALLPYDPGDSQYASTGPVARIANLFANIYSEGDVTARPPLLTLPFEALLEVVSEPEKDERRWIEVRFPDGRLVWVQRGDVRLDLKPASATELILFARRFVGLPYLWGGTSTYGYDCSGFTQMLYRQMGVAIPRDSGPQARWEGFAPVERSALEPGDLLFFGKSEDKITHTGMHIGGAEFIHATAYRNPVVQVSRLDDPHWSTLLVACRRRR